MRHPRLRGIRAGLCVVLWGAAASATAAPPAAVGLGLATALGTGATARVDPAAALFENPGRLARLSHLEAWSSFSAPAGNDLLHVAVTAPLLSGPALGLGVSRYGGATRRDAIHLGAAHALPGGLAAGAALTVQWQAEADAVQQGFGLDLGLHWQPTPRFEAGVALANAVAPEFATPAAPARELRTAAAWMQTLAPAWSAGLTAGWRVRDGGDQEAGAAALVRHGAAEFATGVDAGAWRAGAALALGVWRLAYTYGAADAGTHDVALAWRFGPSRDARRAAAARRTELEIAGRVHELAAQVDHRRAATCAAAAESALARAHFDAAAAHFAALLALQPENPRARVGLVRAQHGMWVHIADSLLAQQEPAAAMAALQQALRHVPEDSASARRVDELRTAASTASRMQDLVAQRYADGLQAHAQQRYLDAVRAFEDVLRLDPEHASAGAALQQARRAHRAWRTNTLRTARERSEAGDDREAAALVRRVLDVEPRHAEARKLLERIETRAARAAADAAPPASPLLAVQSEDAAPASPAVVARYAEGMQLFRGGDLVGAMHAWEEVSRQTPHYDEVDRNLLRVYRVTGLESYTEGRVHEAIEIWEKALRLDPGNEQLRRYLNQAYEKLKRTQPVEPPGR